MSSAAEILVVILSVALAIFITLGIVCFVLIIRVTRQIGDVTENMRNVSRSVDEITKNIAQITSPIIIAKSVVDIYNKFKKKGEKSWFHPV
jgi:predicted PurR-regulated permease PerM